MALTRHQKFADLLKAFMRDAQLITDSRMQATAWIRCDLGATPIPEPDFSTPEAIFSYFQDVASQERYYPSLPKTFRRNFNQEALPSFNEFMDLDENHCLEEKAKPPIPMKGECLGHYLKRLFGRLTAKDSRSPTMK